jgi:hypothetical protein
MHSGRSTSSNNALAYGARRVLRRVHLLRLSHHAEVLFVGTWGRLSGRYSMSGRRGSRWRNLTKLVSKTQAAKAARAPRGRPGHLRSAPQALALFDLTTLPQFLFRPSFGRQRGSTTTTHHFPAAPRPCLDIGAARALRIMPVLFI